MDMAFLNSEICRMTTNSWSRKTACHTAPQVCSTHCGTLPRLLASREESCPSAMTPPRTMQGIRRKLPSVGGGGPAGA